MLNRMDERAYHVKKAVVAIAEALSSIMAGDCRDNAGLVGGKVVVLRPALALHLSFPLSQFEISQV